MQFTPLRSRIDIRISSWTRNKRIQVIYPPSSGRSNLQLKLLIRTTVSWPVAFILTALLLGDFATCDVRRAPSFLFLYFKRNEKRMFWTCTIYNKTDLWATSFLFVLKEPIYILRVYVQRTIKRTGILIGHQLSFHSVFRTNLDRSNHDQQHLLLNEVISSATSTSLQYRDCSFQ